MVMQSGRCVALGAPLDILTPALIRRIFAVDARLIAHPADGLPLFAFQRLA